MGALGRRRGALLFVVLAVAVVAAVEAVNA